MTDHRCLHGVNLGGWLVLEKWMTPTLFQDTDARDEYTFMQTKAALEKITHHRQTFIAEDDWRWLAGHSIDIVRIPVGYWLVRPDGPYTGGVEYLDWAFRMAEKYHIRVLIDLHGAPGSQNGNDHSGKIGDAGWFHDASARTKTVDILEILHERYKNSTQYWGLQLMNEPQTRLVQRTLRKFYHQAAQRLAGNQRIWKITDVENPIAKFALALIAITLIMCAWIFVLCWYFVMYILFGVFFFIFRLFTRGRRKSKRDKLRHREVLDAIEQHKTL